MHTSVHAAARVTRMHKLKGYEERINQSDYVAALGARQR